MLEWAYEQKVGVDNMISLENYLVITCVQIGKKIGSTI